ncbi:MAG: hypothetical protein HQL61_07860 [Magnetococcales bacterium]|nr:hypothetical protein [Nitrospirota bacterium]
MGRRKGSKNKKTSETAKSETGKKRNINPNTATAVAEDVSEHAKNSVGRVGHAVTESAASSTKKVVRGGIMGAARTGKAISKHAGKLGTAGAIVSGALAVKDVYDKHKKNTPGDKGNHQNSGGQSSSGGGGGGDVVVQGYTKDDGTVVKGYTRSRP